jgi:RHH-type transcriptional regulator, rel operon repressor / antitoxin RelB
MAISVRLNPEIEQRLEHLASQTGRAKSDYLRELIEGVLDDLEDFYFADAAMERIRKGQESIFEASDVRESLQL